MLGFDLECLELYGKYVVKVELVALVDFVDWLCVKYVFVLVMMPILFGEGKIVTAIGLG